SQQVAKITTFGSVTTQLKRKLYVYVRAMTDYSPQQDLTMPCADAGMSFRRGDILEIVDQTDTLWWQAKKLPSNTACAGPIPSTSLLKRSDMVLLKMSIQPISLYQSEGERAEVGDSKY
uniref:SH3 domain-containing protein n=1 Tax=Amphilophus citrinellus TaxID=61819 RepID=A0A3Q0S8R9_AMPCI